MREGRGKGTVAVLVAGSRYAGKSLALRQLELSGYDCVDNLPIRLLPECLARAMARGTGRGGRFAASIDAGGEDPAESAALLARARNDVEVAGGRCRIVFLLASDSALRERHAASDSIDAATDTAAAARRDAERSALEPIRASADLVLDTSYASPAEERDLILAAAEGEVPARSAVVELSSFGFKHGAPAGDVVVDVRFIPNPYYVPELRPLSGKDKACADYVLGHESARRALEGLVALAAAMEPAYAAQGRPVLRIRVGCTGGRHRSVAMVEALGAALAERGIAAVIRHRDLERHGPAEAAKA